MRFGLVGGAVFATDVLVFLVGGSWLGVHYLLANGAGKIAGAVLGFILHRSFTFKGKKEYEPTTQAVAYVILLGANIVLASALLHLGVRVLSMVALTAKILSDIIVVMVSFVASRQVVFRAYRAP